MIVAQTGLGTAFLRSLLLPLVFLAPGVPALRLKRWAARRNGRPPRFQLIVYGTLLSGASLVTLYFGVSWLNWELVTVKTLDELSLFEELLLFVAHLALTCVYGLLAGEVQYNYGSGNLPRDLYDSWDFAFEKVYQGGDVVLKTTGGTWIRGRVVQSGSSEEKQDLLFESARVLDAPRDGVTSVSSTQESTPEVYYNGYEALRQTESTDEGPEETDSADELSGMDKIVAEDSIKTPAGNYVQIEEENIEAVILCGGTDMNPEAEIADEKNAAAQTIIQELTESSFQIPRLSTDRLNGHGTALLVLVLASVTVSVFLLSALDSLFSAMTLPLLCLGTLSATATILYFRTKTLDLCVGRISSVGSGKTLGAFVVLTLPVLVWYRPVTEATPLLSGVLVGTAFATLHLSVADDFDSTSASLLTVLGIILVSSAAVWFKPWATEWMWRLVSFVAFGIVVLLTVDRLRKGTPSSYDRWSEVVKSVSWWGVVVLVTAFVVMALQLNPWLFVVAVVLSVVPLFMIRQAVKRQLD